MAQETRVAPITLNDDASKILMDLGDSLVKNKQQKNQLAYEKNKFYQEQLKSNENNIIAESNKFSDYVNSSGDKLTAQASQTALQELRQKTSAALEANRKGDMGSFGNFHQDLNTSLQNIAALKANGQGLTNQVTAYSKEIPLLNTAELTKALDPLRLMPPEKVDVVNNDYVGKLLNSPDGWRYYNLPESNKALTTYVSKPEGGLQTQSKIIGEKNGRKIESESIKYTADPRWYEFTGTDGAPVLKADQHGLLRSDVYSAITENKAFDAALTEKATNFLEHWNDPKLSQKDKEAFMTSMGIDNYAVESDGLSHKTLSAKDDPEVFNTIKRAFATHLISQNSQPSSNEKNFTSINVSSGGTNGGKVVPFIPAYDNLNFVFDPKNKDTRYISVNEGKNKTLIGVPVNRLDNNLSSNILKIVNDKYPSGKPQNSSNPLQTGKIEYSQGDIIVDKVNGKIKVFEANKDGKGDVTSKGKELATIDKTSFDLMVNQTNGQPIDNTIINKEVKTTGGSHL